MPSGRERALGEGLTTRPSGADVALALGVLVTLLLVGLISARAFLFGSTAGNWFYPYYTQGGHRGFGVFLAVLPAVVAATWASQRHIGRYPWLCIAGWLVLGFAVQLALRWSYPISLEAIILSKTANSFYHPAMEYSFGEFLRLAQSGSDALPLHARSNLPGKVTLYYALVQLTMQPQTLGYLIIGLSNLGGVLVYAIARELDLDKTAALYALVFSLFVPCKVFFLPLLNTVSPLAILVAFYVHLRFLRSGRAGWAVLLGISLYGVAFFEPLLLATGLVFAAFLGRALRMGTLSLRSAATLLLASSGAFLAVHVFMLSALEYDLVANFGLALDEARRFNELVHRPYALWLGENLLEFGINTGAGQAALLLFVAGSALRPARRTSDASRLERLVRPPALLAVSSLTVLVALDLLGVNRGEVTRLWIFLAVFLQIPVAHLLAQPGGIARFCIALGCMLLQAAVTLAQVAFVIP